MESERFLTKFDTYSGVELDISNDISNNSNNKYVYKAKHEFGTFDRRRSLLYNQHSSKIIYEDNISKYKLLNLRRNRIKPDNGNISRRKKINNIIIKSKSFNNYKKNNNTYFKHKRTYSDPVTIQDMNEIIIIMKNEQKNKLNGRLNLIKKISDKNIGFNTIPPKIRLNKLVSCKNSEKGPNISKINLIPRVKTSHNVIDIKHNVTYAEILKSARPLDLIGFKNSTMYSSSNINSHEETQDGIFTHTGIVVTRDILPDIKVLQKNKLYVWEPIIIHDISLLLKNYNQNGSRGIQIRDLEKLYDEMNESSEIALAKLVNNPWVTKMFKSCTGLKDQQTLIINNFSKIHKNCHILKNKNHNKILSKPKFKHYIAENHDKTLVATIGINDVLKSNTLLSSEMIGLIYKKINIIPKNIDIKIITAADLLGFDQSIIPPIIQNIIYFDKNGKREKY